MGILRLQAAWAAPSASDDGSWSTDGGTPWLLPSAAGIGVTEQTALANPVVWDCQKIITEAVGQTPIHLYERDRSDPDIRNKSSSALAYRLREQPSESMSAFHFKEVMQRAACFYECAFAEITWRGAEPVDITPRHPTRIRQEKLANGKLRYAYREDDGHTWRPILREDMLVVPGTPVLRYARDSIGAAIALERYAARLFGRGVKPAGLISTSPTVDYGDEDRKKLKEAIAKEHQGADNAGGILMLPTGLSYTQLGMTNQQAELNLLRAMTVAEIARWWRIPPYMLGLLEAGTVSYASVNTQAIDFVVYTLMPWFVRWEQAISLDLIVDKERTFAEFLAANLMRGTTKERYEVYRIGLQWGILSDNEVRRMENLPPREGGDKYGESVLWQKDDEGQEQLPSARHIEAGSSADRLLQALTRDAAGRVVRRETSALAKLAERVGPDAKGWEAGVREFYDTHAGYVAEALHLPRGAALAYADGQRYQVLSEGPAIAAAWDGEVQDRLVTLALHEGTM